MFRESHKGFTLIELLVVVAIIGLLAAVIIINLNIARTKSRDARRKSDLESVKAAIEMYNQKNFSYPSTGGCWSLSGPNGDGTYPSGGGFCSLSHQGPTVWVPDVVSAGFLPVLPVDPRNNVEPYRYWYKSDGDDYKIMAQVIESSEGLQWATNDGGNVNCAPPNNHPGDGYCGYELFTPGGQGY